MLRRRMPLIALAVVALCSLGATRHYRVDSQTGSRGISTYKNERSVLCEGTNDVVDFGNTLAVDLSTTEFTISLWLKPTTMDGVRDLVAKATPFAGPIFNYGMGITDDERLFGYFGSSAKTTQSAAYGLVTTSYWQHVVYTVRNVSGTFTGSIWLDGQQQGSDVTLPGTDDASAIPFRICASKVADSPDTARPYTGYIDEVTVWSVGFANADVDEAYNLSDPISPLRHSKSAYLTHWYRMGDDGDVYPAITDRVGSIHGTATGMTSAANNYVPVVP
jgi:hypothetical protein